MSGIVGGSGKSGITNRNHDSYCFGCGDDNTYSSSQVIWNNTRLSGRDFSFEGGSSSNDDDSYQIFPLSTGVYFVQCGWNFTNEGPDATEDDGGRVYLTFNGNDVAISRFHFRIGSSPTSDHEGQYGNLQHVQVVSTLGGNNFFALKPHNFGGMGGYNERYWIAIWKVGGNINSGIAGQSTNYYAL